MSHAPRRGAARARLGRHSERSRRRLGLTELDRTGGRIRTGLAGGRARLAPRRGGATRSDSDGRLGRGRERRPDGAPGDLEQLPDEGGQPAAGLVVGDDLAHRPCARRPPRGAGLVAQQPHARGPAARRGAVGRGGEARRGGSLGRGGGGLT